MSVVVGLKYKNKVWLACDRQVTSGDTKTILQHSHNKIVHVPNREGILVGSVGLLRGINLLETNNSYIDELCYLRGEIDYDYMVNAFPLLVKELFVNYEMISDDEKVLNLRNEFLVAVDENLYSVGFDGSVLEIDDFFAIGSGSELAYGSLSSAMKNVNDDTDIKEVLKNAILSASYNVGCGGGVIIMNNVDPEIYQISFE